MSLPMRPRSATPRGDASEGVIALSLIQARGPGLLKEGFHMEGQQGGDALDHLRDVLHDISEQHGVQAVFCVRCGGLVTPEGCVTGEGGPDEIEDEAHAECPQTQQGDEPKCSR